ncbi:MAG: hypothetical protein JWO67_3101 [Streptosporangiaceae bacterium]|jgi:DivIVA domain-containing protein|nr:hypothetical protein [Streptosporangiaceae bacterium]
MTQADEVLTSPNGSGRSAKAAEVTGLMEVEQGTGADAGWLTPSDVHNKVFATVRLREGYDLSQVDTFLYEVENTLHRVLRENAVLRARLHDPRQHRPTAAEGASRIVAMAQETADRAIATAQQEARDIVAEARDHAEAVKREARNYGNRLRDSLEHQIGQLRGLLVEIDEQEDTY